MRSNKEQDDQNPIDLVCLPLAGNILIATQRNNPRLAVGVQVWLLANSNRTMTCAVAQLVVIIGSTVKDAAVIPERLKPLVFAITNCGAGILTNVVLVPPLESDLQIVVFFDSFVKLIQELFTLFG